MILMTSFTDQTNCNCKCPIAHHLLQVSLCLVHCVSLLRSAFAALKEH